MCVFSFRYAAKDKHLLQSLNITYVLNAAHGKFSVNTGASFYRDTKISYHGVEAFDMPSFDLSPFFYSAAKFIKTAMSTPGGEERKHISYSNAEFKRKLNLIYQEEIVSVFRTIKIFFFFLHHDIIFIL